jgi:hypothetical protein
MLPPSSGSKEKRNKEAASKNTECKTEGGRLRKKQIREMIK